MKKILSFFIFSGIFLSGCSHEISELETTPTPNSEVIQGDISPEKNPAQEEEKDLKEIGEIPLDDLKETETREEKYFLYYYKDGVLNEDNGKNPFDSYPKYPVVRKINFDFLQTSTLPVNENNLLEKSDFNEEGILKFFESEYEQDDPQKNDIVYKDGKLVLFGIIELSSFDDIYPSIGPFIFIDYKNLKIDPPYSEKEIIYECNGPLEKGNRYKNCETNGKDYLEQFELDQQGFNIGVADTLPLVWSKIYIKKFGDKNIVLKSFIHSDKYYISGANKYSNEEKEAIKNIAEEDFEKIVSNPKNQELIKELDKQAEEFFGKVKILREPVNSVVSSELEEKIKENIFVQKIPIEEYKKSLVLCEGDGDIEGLEQRIFGELCFSKEGVEQELEKIDNLKNGIFPKNVKEEFRLKNYNGYFFFSERGCCDHYDGDWALHALIVDEDYVYRISDIPYWFFSNEDRMLAEKSLMNYYEGFTKADLGKKAVDESRIILDEETAKFRHSDLFKSSDHPINYHFKGERFLMVFPLEIQDAFIKNLEAIKNYIEEGKFKE
jgi:hypothetical protein